MPLLTAGFAAAGTVPAWALTGTVTLRGGYLTISPPPPLAWSAPLTGHDQWVMDGLGADQEYVVNDATGTGLGWNVTISASPFSCIGGGCSGSQLPNDGTLATNGSLLSATAPDQPSQACVAGASCIPPQNQLTYPVDVTTGGNPTKIFDSTADAGIGSVTIGGSGNANPVGWWLSIGKDVRAGSYSSLMTVAVNAGP